MTRYARWYPATLSLLLSPFWAAEIKMPPAASVKVDFDRHVRPILAEKCFNCHGPMQQQAGLRLDKRQPALRGGDYGPVILPGKGSESKLVRRLVSGDGGLQMPPTGPLSADEIGILRAWIDQGGEYGDVEIKDDPKPEPVDPRVKAFISAIRAHDDTAVARMLEANHTLAEARDSSGSTPLHHAAGFGSMATIRILLDHACAVSARNRLNSTPLHWAITDEAKVRLLLDHGADINAKTVDGRTPLYLAATQRHSDSVLRLLLARGADPKIATLTGRTPLMAAAAAGATTAMKALLAKGADVHHASGGGSIALMDAAASGRADAVALLLEKGAEVNARTKRGLSALSMAAMDGSEEIVRMLLDRGAEVNFQDDRGYSPLMYAAYSETMPSGIVRMLLAKGARTDYEGEGETAVSLAGKRGDNEVARLLGVPATVRKSGGVVAAGVRPAGNRALPEAVAAAAAVVARQSPMFIKRGGCNSCHNQSLPAVALTLARERGMKAPDTFAELPDEMIERSADRTMDMAVIGVNSVAYEIFGHIGKRRPADEYTDALVHYLKAMQTPEGKWETTGSRPPLTSDHFQTTAMVAYALREYSPAPEKADTAARLARAAAWFEAASPVTTQERAFHLLGLRWSGGSAATIERAARELSRTQRADGGWAQLPTMGSDAYATGEALYALAVAAKMSPKNPVYAKGIRYLLGTQAADGSWHVKTRSLPFQPYFDSGFPYGHDQWISTAGTSYAIMALALAAEERALTSQRK